MSVVQLGRLRLQVARVASSYEAAQIAADLPTLRIPHSATVPPFAPPLQLDWGTLPSEQHLRDCVARMSGVPLTHQELWRVQSSPPRPTPAAPIAGDDERVLAAVFYPEGGTRLAFPSLDVTLQVLAGDLVTWTWRQGLDPVALPAAGLELITWVRASPVLDPTELPTRRIPRIQ